MDPIPWELAAPIAGALVAAIGALWRELQRERRAWAAAVKRMSRALRTARIRDERRQGRITSDPPPDDYEDTTEVRARTADVDCEYFGAPAELDAHLRDYLVSTPPRK